MAMRICAEIKCYYCGHVSGQICGDSDGPLHWEELRPNPSFKGAIPRPGESLRCFRCGGPIYLDEIEKERVAPRRSTEEFARRGGRRKRAVAA